MAQEIRCPGPAAKLAKAKQNIEQLNDTADCADSSSSLESKVIPFVRPEHGTREWVRELQPHGIDFDTLTPEQVGWLTPAQLEDISAEQWEKLPGYLIRAELSGTLIAHMPDDYLKFLTPEQINKVRGKTMLKLTPDQLRHVTEEQLEIGLSTPDRKLFSREQRAAVSDHLRAIATRKLKQEHEMKLDDLYSKYGLLERGEVKSIFGDDDEYVSTSDMQRRFVIVGWIYLGKVTLLHGEGKVGKSTIVRALALALLRCAAFCRSLVTDNCDAPLIFATSEDSLGDTIEGLKEQSRLTPGPRMVHEPIILPSQGRSLMEKGDRGRWEASEFLEDIEKLISNTGACVLILDNLGTLTTNMTITLDDHMRPLMMELSRIASEYDIAVILVHHSSGSGLLSEPFGSKYIKNQSRSVIKVHKVGGKSNRVKMIHQYDNHGPCYPHKPAIEFERVGAAIREVEPTPEAQGTNKKTPTTAEAAQPVDEVAIVECVLSWLREHPETMVTPGGLVQGKGPGAEPLREHLLASFPGVKSGVFATAINAGIEAGTIAELPRLVKSNGGRKKVLSLPKPGEEK